MPAAAVTDPARGLAIGGRIVDSRGEGVIGPTAGARTGNAPAAAPDPRRPEARAPGRRAFLAGLAWLILAPRARAGVLDGLSGGEAAQAVRESLEHGARAALAKLGAKNGYFANPRVRIGLPRNFARSERILRGLGLGRQVDDLVLAMNRAAEEAMPQARELVLEAVRTMNVQDAPRILTGGDDAATRYFRQATQAQLGEKLMPALRSVTEQSGLARAYNALAASLMSIAGLRSELSSVERYVNDKALDGLYAQIAEEERDLRRNPGKVAGSLLGKVFGLLQ